MEFSSTRETGNNRYDKIFFADSINNDKSKVHVDKYNTVR